jgi:septal ring factor EnvC (AmiA/AmiB activator)
MAVPKPTMQAIDWEPQLAALDATLKEVQQEAERIGNRIKEVQKENEAIDRELEEIFTRNKSQINLTQI